MDTSDDKIEDPTPRAPTSPTPVTASAMTPEALRVIISRGKRWDLVMALAGVMALGVGLVTLLALIVNLAVDGVPRLSYDFFTSFPSRRADSAGILSAWVGSAVVMMLTACIAVPLGVAAGLYLEEYAPKNAFTSFIEINIANLAGVPSIVYGLLALGLFVYQLGLGQSIITAGFTLSLLILSIVIITTREAVRAIPQHIREASYAMGASRWQTVRDHVLPYSTGGILTGVIIALSRAIGETAPLITIGALTFIAFLPTPPVQADFPFVSFAWLKDPFTVLPIQMFNWISRPQEAFHINAAAAGIVLIGMTLTMNAIAIVIRYRFRKRIKW